MTAIIGTQANLSTGLVQAGRVTNTYGGYLQSAGVAYNLVLPFQADQFEWWRATNYGTAGTVGQGVWFRDMAANTELAQEAIADNGTTGNLNLLLNTSTGITINNTLASFPNEHLVISSVSAAVPGVVTTTTPHGLVNGSRVIITKVIGSIGSSVNNITFVASVLSATTFALYDVFGAPVPTTGTYTSSGQVTLTGPSLNIQNGPAVFALTLGAQVMGADNDVIYFKATKFNSYYNLGDVLVV